MPDKHTIDFLIIGAQKAGTTSLFKYLSRHPQIYMAPEKEVEFFQDENKFSQGKDWYINKYFGRAADHHIKGEASTFYMMYSCVPERIYNYFPEVKLIALLRNPIDRSYSHYRMAIRRQKEDRSFADSVADSISSGELPDSRIDHNKCYLFFGEYGRIMQNYLKWFSKKQVKIIFSEDLARCPQLVVQDIYGFLGVDSNFTPDNIGKIYHVGGMQRIPELNKWMRTRIEWLKRQKLLGNIVRKIDFEAFLFWLETQFNVRPSKEPGMSGTERAMLTQHYANDVSLLERLFDVKVPWNEFKGD